MKMKHIHTFEDYLFESELNELKLTSAGVKELLSAIYYNWEKIKMQIKKDLYFNDFKDVIGYIKSGDQEEQQKLESWIKSQGINILTI
jgi:hypothetical protein